MLYWGYYLKISGGTPTNIPGSNSEREPPDPILKSEVKTISAEGSVGSVHVRVGHRQDLFIKSRIPVSGCGFFYCRYDRVMSDISEVALYGRFACF